MTKYSEVLHVALPAPVGEPCDAFFFEYGVVCEWGGRKGFAAARVACLGWVSRGGLGTRSDLHTCYWRATVLHQEQQLRSGGCCRGITS
jgi:hypothetical protein